ncbi:MAG: hypothetical protein K5925_00245 [Bacilli bacterium]|nr:hypothetical protein [Bacilli bacterium]
MIKKVVRFSIPEYREKKEMYEALGYKEVASKEHGGYKIAVTYEMDETPEHYKEIRKIEKRITVKGPIFLPIILFVIGAFILLSCFVIALGRSMRDSAPFDLTTNALSYLLPAFILLFADVVYTYFYFKINRRLMLIPKPTIEEIEQRVEEIKKN